MDKKNWINTFKAFIKPSNLAMLFLGFSAGLPILLIFSSLSLWLREAGVERAAVTYFSWAALGYSFKFVWAPIVDRLPLPLIGRLGRRKSWLLVSQSLIILAILGMAFTDPATSNMALTYMAIFAVLLGFSSATQDIVIDAYRIESDVADMQAILSSTYIAGYRIGMIVAGAGALFIASYLGSTKDLYSYSAWKWTYIIMAMCMAIGVFTTLIVPEPKNESKNKNEYLTIDYIKFFMFFITLTAAFIFTFVYSGRYFSSLSDTLVDLTGKSLGLFLFQAFKFLSAIIGALVTALMVLKTNVVNKNMVKQSYVKPMQDFFSRYGMSVALLLLCLIGMYRLSDIVLGVISNVFYQDLGFSKDQIAAIVKTFGLIMTLVGGFLGGILTIRFGVIKILFWGALLSSGTNLLFMILADMGNNLPMLYLVISADNLAAGLASAAFIAFLSSLTNISFTAVQYAVFSSLMTLLPKVFGGYSGSIVDNFGYSKFFLITTVIGLPVLLLVWLAGKKLEVSSQK